MSQMKPIIRQWLTRFLCYNKIMIEIRDSEKCYYCDNVAEYNQIVGLSKDEFAVSGVCQKHFINETP